MLTELFAPFGRLGSNFINFIICNPAGGILFFFALIHVLMIESKVQMKPLLRISRILGKVALEFHINPVSTLRDLL